MSATAVTFRMPGGLPVPLELDDAQTDGSVRLRLTASPETWQLVEGAFLFHLDSAGVDGHVPKMLDPARPATFTVQLDEGLAGAVSPGTTPAALRELLAAAGEGDGERRLAHTDSWWILEAAQPEPSGRLAQVFRREAPVGTNQPVQVEVDLDEAGDEDGTEPPTALTAAAMRVLEAMELPYRQMSESLVHAHVTGEEGQFELFVHARPGRDQLLCYATWPQLVDADRRPAVMELVTRLNKELTVAWFECDLDEGTVSARTGVDFADVPAPDLTVIRNAIRGSVRAMDRFLPAVRAVAVEGLEPADLEG